MRIQVKEYKKEIICLAIVCIASAFFLNNDDQMTIAEWGRTWWICVVENKMSLFSIMCTQAGHSINYGFITASLIGGCYAPVFAVEQIIGHELSILVYAFYFKCLLIVVNFVNLYLIVNIMQRLGGDLKRALATSFMIFVGPSVQLFSIGIGQIDAIIIMLMLFGILCFIDDRRILMIVCFSVAVIMKPFPVFIAVPCILYMIEKEHKLVFAAIGIPCLFYGVQWYMENSILNYQEGKESWEFTSRLFADQINYTSIVLVVLLVVGFCFLTQLLEKNIEKIDVIKYAGILFVAFDVLVLMHSQWYIYTFIIWAIYVVATGQTMYFQLLLLGAELGNIGYATFLLSKINQFYIEYGIIGMLHPYGGKVLGEFLNRNLKYGFEISHSLLSACLILMPMICIIHKKEGAMRQPSEKMEKIMQLTSVGLTAAIESILIVSYLV